MENFTIVDAVVAAIVLMSGVLAYSRGLVRELFAIAGWVVAAIVAFKFADRAAPLVSQIPVLDKFLGDNCELAVMSGFFAIFAGALIVMSILTPLFSAIIQRSALSGIDQGLGFLFGVLRGVVLVAVALLVYNKMVTADTIPMVDNSRSAQVFASVSDRLGAEVPTDAAGMAKGYYNELMKSCGAGITTEAAPSEESPAADGTGAKTVTP
jgi:membrane protein required for colicin V production